MAAVAALPQYWTYYPGYPLRTLSYPASTSPLTVAYPSYPGYPGAFLGLRSPALFSAPLNVVQVRHTGNTHGSVQPSVISA